MLGNGSYFYLWVLHPVAHLSNLVSYDAVNRNKVSIRHSPFLFFIPTHYMFRPLQAIFRWDIQLMFTRTIPTTTDPLYVHNLTYVYDASTRGPEYMLSNVV
jgi:hypothetical protein